mmetsp:Transcript_34273/g.79194  ORF Transcript_34273/g.79194 Transcript_34273/m.79194 type:complete len:308 (+) Transcript_34273:313-1236(+)|eukprot:CAMPEP_0182573994 /NCGR_PEP_ID=MMETSP1324-20130603/21364_1 /TAXON_ID=236786 /ORGANISM="Florenciella sp., Strain RCC1587" /LENGTH=307 /DNA_ID=CAMNT_0024789209 /DNA_START=235 /DNA_END=1158 /DNA_ORIENTATION=+
MAAPQAKHAHGRSNRSMDPAKHMPQGQEKDWGGHLSRLVTTPDSNDLRTHITLGEAPPISVAMFEKHSKWKRTSKAADAGAQEGAGTKSGDAHAGGQSSSHMDRHELANDVGSNEDDEEHDTDGEDEEQERVDVEEKRTGTVTTLVNKKYYFLRGMKMFSIKSEVEVEEEGRQYGVAQIPARFTPTTPGRQRESSTQVIPRIRHPAYDEQHHIEYPTIIQSDKSKRESQMPPPPPASGSIVANRSSPSLGGGGGAVDGAIDDGDASFAAVAAASPAEERNSSCANLNCTNDSDTPVPTAPHFTEPRW